MPNLSVLRALARCFVAGEPTPEQITARSARTLGREWRWLRPVAERYANSVAGRTRPRHREAMQFLLQDAGFKRAWAKYCHSLSIADWMTHPHSMQPVPAAADWGMPRIESAGDLADHLHLTPGELDWYADLKGLTHRKNHPALAHYRYRAIAKRSGGMRLIEAPKPNLKAVQRRILEEILDRVPPHPSVHGFVNARSVSTFARPHAGRRVVLKMDLQDFFPSFPAARIQTVFRTLGYSEPVADLLGGICTNAAPRGVAHGIGDTYSRPHLPQGAPTSPALANICAWRADCRLNGLAEAGGALYSRYADDLVFSGGDDFERRVERFSFHAAAVLMEEGFRVNHRKTRIMRQGVRQKIVGLVVNRHLNLPRKDFDNLKAILTNCIRLGAVSQNREGHPAFQAHLDGRVGFAETINPGRGKRLRDLFRQIRWEGESTG